jgi:hypothetical protein
MEYGLLLTLDQEYEPAGFFSFETTVGSIVVAFTDPSRLQAAAWGAAKMTEGQGTKVGSTNIEADSLEDLLAQLMGMGWDGSEASLVLDTDELGQQLLAQLAPD